MTGDQLNSRIAQDFLDLLGLTASPALPLQLDRATGPLIVDCLSLMVDFVRKR